MNLFPVDVLGRTHDDTKEALAAVLHLLDLSWRIADLLPPATKGRQELRGNEWYGEIEFLHTVEFQAASRARCGYDMVAEEFTVARVSLSTPHGNEHTPQPFRLRDEGCPNAHAAVISLAEAGENLLREWLRRIKHVAGEMDQGRQNIVMPEMGLAFCLEYLGVRRLADLNVTTALQQEYAIANERRHSSNAPSGIAEIRKLAVDAVDAIRMLSRAHTAALVGSRVAPLTSVFEIGERRPLERLRYLLELARMHLPTDEAMAAATNAVADATRRLREARQFGPVKLEYLTEASEAVFAALCDRSESEDAGPIAGKTKRAGKIPSDYVGPYRKDVLLKMFHTTDSTLRRRMKGESHPPIRSIKVDGKWEWYVHRDDCPGDPKK